MRDGVEKRQSQRQSREEIELKEEQRRYLVRERVRYTQSMRWVGEVTMLSSVKYEKESNYKQQNNSPDLVSDVEEIYVLQVQVLAAMVLEEETGAEDEDINSRILLFYSSFYINRKIYILFNRFNLGCKMF